MKSSLLRSTISCALLISGCSVGPTYQPPKEQGAAEFQSESDPSLIKGEVEKEWWKHVHDDSLVDLVNQAITQNNDLQQAISRIREARFLRLQARLDLVPTVTAGGDYSHRLQNIPGFNGIPRSAREFELYQYSVDATWELDFWGRVRHSVGAATADLQSAEASMRDLMVTLIGEVATNYMELRGLQHSLAVAERNAKNQEDTLRITRIRLDAGRGTELDTSRAEAQYQSTVSQIPLLKGSIKQTLHRLSLLLGKEPQEIYPLLTPTKQLPTLPIQFAIGSPYDLLRRRQDVRAAERQLAAQTARVGVATADLYPRFTFNGNIGANGTTPSKLASDGELWSFGPRFSWPAFDMFRVRARLQGAEARLQGVYAQYQQTVLAALHEAENAVTNFVANKQRLGNLAKARDAARKAAELARIRYQDGASDFITVLDAERELLQAESTLVRGETDTAKAFVALYKALGGGWENFDIEKKSSK